MFLKNKETGSICEAAIHQGEGWEIMSKSAIITYILANAKVEKLKSLKRNRDLKTGGSESSSSASGNFVIKNSDLPVLFARRDYLAGQKDTSETLPWTNVEGGEIELDVDEFSDLINKINDNDVTTWRDYNAKKLKLNSLTTTKAVEAFSTEL